jgi:hypothetical protein
MKEERKGRKRNKKGMKRKDGRNKGETDWEINKKTDKNKSRKRGKENKRASVV